MQFMHQEAQKLRTVGFPRRVESFSVGDPLNPSNVQSGSAFPGEVKLWGVHAGNGEPFGLLVHATNASSIQTAIREGARTD